MTRLLGRGGMGEVWAAAGEGPGGVRREVAIKVLLARAAMKPDLVRRFEREAKIASAIKSPYVCQIIEVGEADDGAHLLVFEQLSGESLADRLKREQYLPFSEVGPIIEDVLQGLVAAHAAGVIHRDLKPGNIFLDQLKEEGEAAYAPPSGGFGFGSTPPPVRRERAKILDFGISKLSRREKEEPTLTAFDATLGSFAYMAPEQVRGAARADERADIYAVGAVAFRALSGRLPFEGATAAVLVAMKLDRQAPSLAEATGEQWPAGIERFLERALERNREQRFASAAEALEVWRSIQPSAVVTKAPRPAAVEPDRPPPVVSRVVQVPPAAVEPERPPRPLAPARSKTPIPAPTKPMVSVRMPLASDPGTIDAGRIIADPSTLDVPRAAIRQGGRHGTLTMDELPSPIVAEPTPPPRSTPPPPRAPLPSVPVMPAPRPPMQSYQIIEDNPTEVDGPPEMTFDGSYNPLAAADLALHPPPDRSPEGAATGPKPRSPEGGPGGAKRGRTGRP